MEEYKTIEGFENYQISSFGNVKDISTGRIFSYDIINPYSTVFLYKENTRYTFGVHKLVGEAFIPNPDNKLCVDHIDCNKQNNNIDNLRWATKAENNKNRQLMKNNSSGYVGVYYDKRCNKWTAKIGHEGKLKNLGIFDKKEDALKVRLKAVQKYHGEYASKREKDLIINMNKILVKIDIDEDYQALERELNDLIKK
jgi:hypothetical protein